MARWIEHICEPSRLLLAWQSPDLNGDRTRFAVGELVREDKDCVLRYFESSEVDQAKRLGYRGYPAFRINKREHSGGILPTFLRRLPPRRRADFPDYMAQFRLAKDASISDFALLAYTGAKLPSDGFSIVDPLEDFSPPCEVLTEIAGYRHYAPKLSQQPRIGTDLALMPEPDNAYDPKAIAIKCDGETIGYVNRLQTGPFHKWLPRGFVHATVERLNGAADRPRAFMFVGFADTRNRAAA